MLSLFLLLRLGGVVRVGELKEFFMPLSKFWVPLLPFWEGASELNFPRLARIAKGVEKRWKKNRGASEEGKGFSEGFSPLTV
jgi:hypothetical protein